MQKAILFSLFFSLWNLLTVDAQLNHWVEFQTQLETYGLQLSVPVENQYKAIKNKSQLRTCDYAVSKRNGDLEIRFIIIPSDSIFFPHMNAMSLITTLATNEQETVISLLSVGANNLDESYKADWGLQAYFTPKSSFSEKQHCKLLALYKEEKAMAYLLYLFDEPTEELEQQRYILQFK